MIARDFTDLSREREDDFLAGASDDFRARALERADRLREVSDVADMSWPTADIAMERVRPAVRNDDEALAPMRGLLIGIAIGLGMWAGVVLTAVVAS